MDARWRWAIWASVAMAAVLASSAAVVADTQPAKVSSVSGFEVAATPTQGQFVGSLGKGTALAGGYFYAKVIHQTLNEQGTGSVTAVCGTGEASSITVSPCNSGTPMSSVTVYLTSGKAVTGEFEYADSGSDSSNRGIVFEQNVGGTPSCPSRQYFSVADVVNFSQLHSSYEFSVTLTHYSYDLFGDCITYFATISGTMTLQ